MKSTGKVKTRSVHVGFLFLGALLLATSGYYYFGLEGGVVHSFMVPELFKAQDRFLLRVGIFLGAFFLLTTNRFTLYQTGAVRKSFCFLGLLPWYQRTYHPGYFNRVEMMLLIAQGTGGRGGGHSIHLLLVGQGKIELNLGRYLSPESAKKAGEAAANALGIPFVPELKSTDQRWKEARNK